MNIDTMTPEQLAFLLFPLVVIISLIIVGVVLLYRSQYRALMIFLGAWAIAFGLVLYAVRNIW